MARRSRGEWGTRVLTLRDGAVLEVRSQAGEVVSAYRDGGRLLPSKRHASPRILVESGRDGERPEIILGREQETGGWMLRWLAGSKAVSVTALQWDGTTFHEVWATPPSEEALADYAVVDLGSGLGQHLLLLMVRGGR